jgi:hypothetical protein
MIDYEFKGRLQYIPGGPLHVQMSAWPSVGGNWWEPTTGSFTCVGAYQAKGAASLAASYVNLANPGTNDLTAGTAPTFDTSTGWTFNAAEWLVTGHYANKASTTVIIRFSNAASGVYTMCGTDIHRLMPNRSNLVYYGATTKSPGMTSGVLAIAGETGYRNGTSDGAVSIGNIQGVPYFIGAQNQAGTAAAKWIGKIQAMSIYTTILDATQIAEITANMNAL